MTGVEILGLLASLSQLAAYTINITTSIAEIYHRVQDAPQRIQQHIQQISHLIDTARLIEKHRLLQTDSICAHVNSTLDQAIQVCRIVDKFKGDYDRRSSIRKYWTALKGTKEKEILASLKRLEQEKSALLLCISIVHTDLLGNLQGNYDLPNQHSRLRMPELSNGDLCALERCPTSSLHGEEERMTDISLTKTSYSIVERNERKPLSDRRLSKQIHGDRHPIVLHDRSTEPAFNTTSLPGIPTPERSPGVDDAQAHNQGAETGKPQNKYENVKAIKSKQVNGNLGTAYGEATSLRPHYKDIYAQDTTQLNGDCNELELFKVLFGQPAGHTQ